MILSFWTRRKSKNRLECKIDLSTPNKAVSSLFYSGKLKRFDEPNRFLFTTPPKLDERFCRFFKPIQKFPRQVKKNRLGNTSGSNIPIFDRKTTFVRFRSAKTSVANYIKILLCFTFEFGSLITRT
ncbi:hypothetical protein LEP1GSC060_1659 [Leptospira weilii serovar Ranarum str. ICFT]|uniref:Uncharacterized protein n=1 Tax=Leptospira weilii serovar Ranarum str. ICFT TaxID=1218598 RepID=N1WKD9_9LEPT|nr:hypothetical protein LEP1GSC060_1659 [Leptospira weilii serovar Ranarum str. ICFT]